MRTCKARLLLVPSQLQHTRFQLYFFITDAANATVVSNDCSLAWTAADISRSTYAQLADFFPGDIAFGKPIAKSDVGAVRMLCLCLQCNDKTQALNDVLKATVNGGAPLIASSQFTTRHTCIFVRKRDESDAAVRLAFSELAFSEFRL